MKKHKSSPKGILRLVSKELRTFNCNGDEMNILYPGDAIFIISEKTGAYFGREILTMFGVVYVFDGDIPKNTTRIE